MREATTRSAAVAGVLSLIVFASGLAMRAALVEGRLGRVDPQDFGWVIGVAICYGVQLWLLGSKAKKLLERTIVPLVVSACAAAALIAWTHMETPRAHLLSALGACLCAGLLSYNQGHLAPRIIAVLLLASLGADLVVSRELPLSDFLMLAGVNGLAAALSANRPRRTKLAFGVTPGFRRYELRLMRYVAVGEVVKEVVARQGAARVLDVGCGRGFLKLYCPPEAEMHGVDFSADRVEKSRAAGYNTVQHDLELGTLPFPDEMFDVVVFCHSLEHVRRFDEVVREAARILKPGGKIDIGVPTKVRLFHGVAASYFEGRNTGHGDTVNFFTADGVADRVRAVLPEFTQEELRGFRLFSSRKNLPLEDWRWFWRLSTWWGRKFPNLCPEVNLVLRKPLR